MFRKDMFVRMYRGVVSFYPEQYRKEYADDMVTTFSDLIDEAYEHGGVLRVWSMFLSSFFDTAVQALNENYTHFVKKEDYMAEMQPANPLRGFQRLFWVMVIFTVVFSFLGPVAATFSSYVFYAYFFFLAALLVRSKRGWPVALFTLVFCGIAAFMLAQLVVGIFSHEWMFWLMEKLFHNDFNLIDRVTGIIVSFSYGASFLIVGYVAIREIERPRLRKVWDMVLQERNEANKKKMWRFFVIFLLICLLIASAIFFYENWFLFQNGTMGEDFNGLAYVFGSLYAFSAGGFLELIGLLALAVVIMCAWIFSGKRLWPTALVVAIFIGGFIGLQIVATYEILPTTMQAGGSEGVAISNQEGIALEESCAFQSVQSGESTMEQALKFSNLSTLPPGTNGDLCTKLTTPRLGGDLYYDGSYGSSVNSTTGVPSDFALSAEKLPSVHPASNKPVFYLVSAWFIAFVLPILLTIGAMAFMRRRYSAK